MAKKITPAQLAMQWRTLPNKFEVNLLNFEVAIGSSAVDIFKKSFYLQRFNSAGSYAWPQRQDKKTHPLLKETGSLERSIKFTPIGYRHSQGVMIYSNPNDLMSANRQYGRNFYYARIHNMGGIAAGAGGWASLIRQRQFIGHSSYLTEKFKSKSAIIFNGFPQ